LAQDIELCYRLLRGDTLMRKVLSDYAEGISLLRTQPLIDLKHIGIMGHSYGGNTVLFHGALDERIHRAFSPGVPGVQSPAGPDARANPHSHPLPEVQGRLV
jgi:dienelactone hydrolase